jgi:hypothetical protein
MEKTIVLTLSELQALRSVTKESIADIINYIDCNRKDEFSQVVLTRVYQKLQKIMDAPLPDLSHLFRSTETRF